jgi:hypothetical protein
MQPDRPWLAHMPWVVQRFHRQKEDFFSGPDIGRTSGRFRRIVVHCRQMEDISDNQALQRDLSRPDI